MSSIKRFIAAFMVLILIASIFSACSKEGNKSDEIINNDNELSSVDTSEVDNKPSDEPESELLPNVYQVPVSDNDIFVNVPLLGHQVKSGCTLMCYDDFKRIITVTYSAYIEVEKNEDVFDKLYNNIIGDLKFTHNLNGPYDLDFEKVTVNGIETLKFKGSIDARYVSDSYNSFAYGYAFIFQDIPIVILGSVIDESQPQSDIDFVTEVADAMMKSVRSEA